MSPRRRRPSELVPAATKQRILEAQDGVCAICHRPPGTRALHVDHDHRTGRIRGMLCYGCNRLLLIRGTTPEKLRAAADYLERDTDYGTLT